MFISLRTSLLKIKETASENAAPNAKLIPFILFESGNMAANIQLLKDILPGLNIGMNEAAMTK